MEMMKGSMEGKRGRGRHGLDDGGRIQKTQGKGTTSKRIKSLDIWTCREADDLKKKDRRTMLLP